MEKTFKHVDELPINPNLITRPSISINHWVKQLDEINHQYHDYNKLGFSVDELGQRIQIIYTNDEGIEMPLTDWLLPIQVEVYLQNFQHMFCLDPTKLERFFELDKATAVVPIPWLRPTRKRSKGINNAFLYMRNAYQGIVPRRKPISIRPSKKHTGLFDIIDGNSTWYVAKQLGFMNLPVCIGIT